MSAHQEYKSFQEHTEMINGQARTQEKEVTIKNGVGTKTVRYLGPKGRVLAEKTIPLNGEEKTAIMNKTFVPELFKPCIGHCMKKMNGGTRGHGAIFFTKHSMRRRAAAKARRSRRKNY
jgi:hypothetical protein